MMRVQGSAAGLAKRIGHLLRLVTSRLCGPLVAPEAVIDK
jgi:hypothetical protein